MFGLFRKAGSTLQANGHDVRAFGAGPYEWQPSRTVKPFYSLKNRDEAEYAEFMRRASSAVEWNRSDTYVAAENDPRLDKVEVDSWWWARVEGELWLLAESFWAFFPDPLPYSLSILRSADNGLQNLGHFAVLPTTWTNGPQQVES